MRTDYSDSWPFDQPRNSAAFTTRQIIDGQEEILEVFYDADDHAWQFFGVTGASLKDCALVALEEIVSRDPSVIEVADLRPGWRAIRGKRNEAWTRSPQ